MTTRNPDRSEKPRASELVERVWDRLSIGTARGGSKARKVQAVGEALEAFEERSEALGDLASDVLTRALEAWLDGQDEAALQVLDDATAREVIDAVDLSARGLEEEGRRLREQRDALIGLAKDLGRVGVKLLLGALRAV